MIRGVTRILSVLVLAGCVESTPGDEALAGDCPAVEALAPGYRTRKDARFLAVTTWWGRCAYRDDRLEEAVERLAPVAATAVRSNHVADAIYFSGRARYRLERFEEAVTDFADLTARYGHDGWADDAWYFRGRSELRRGEAPAALDAFEVLLAHPDRSERRAAGGTYHSGRALEKLSRWDDAVARYQAVLDDFGDSIYADNAEYALATLPYARDRFAEAEAALDAFLVSRPESGLRYLADYFRARAVEQQGDLDRALPLFAAHEAAYGDRAFADNARYRIGRGQYTLERHVEAEATLSSVLVQWPDTSLAPSVGYFLGRARYAQKDFDDALDAFGITLEAVKSTYRDNAQYYSGRCHYRSQRYQAAIDAFATVAVDFPDSSYVDDAAYFSARALYELHDLTAAEAAFAELTVIHADSPYLDNGLYYLVLVRLALQDCSRAVESLQTLEDVDDGGFYPKASAALAASECAE